MTNPSGICLRAHSCRRLLMHEPTPPAANSPLPSVTLDLLEARVLGCLIEKEATTPDVYPLSLNALVNACNQKNNRFPAMEAGEREVEGAIDRLRDKRLVTAFSGANARAIKYKHRFSDRFPVEPLAQAMLAELLLRGPQTTAGLRRSEEHTSELQSQSNLVCRLLLEKKKKAKTPYNFLHNIINHTAIPDYE